MSVLVQRRIDSRTHWHNVLNVRYAKVGQETRKQRGVHLIQFRPNNHEATNEYRKGFVHTKRRMHPRATFARADRVHSRIEATIYKTDLPSVHTFGAQVVSPRYDALRLHAHHRGKCAAKRILRKATTLRDASPVRTASQRATLPVMHQRSHWEREFP